VKYHKTYKELLQEPVDVYVHKPSELSGCGSHDRALSKGLHAFCEKPPGRTVSDIKKVVEFLEETFQTASEIRF